MTRKDAIRAIVYAGYHNDKATGTRLYIENRISFTVYTQAFNDGRRMRANGMRCHCHSCEAAS